MHTFGLLVIHYHIVFSTPFNYVSKSLLKQEFKLKTDFDDVCKVVSIAYKSDDKIENHFIL